MKSLYFFDERQLIHIEYPKKKMIFWIAVIFSVGFYLGLIVGWGVWSVENKIVYRTIQYQDSTTVVYQQINPDSIKGDSKVVKDLKFYYRKNKGQK